ncbi:hypothetical protein NON20_12880 [Synechocystis sp. B12]|nr:hypothetical protein NON20_12880 [Synechocystis sp. B12]
MMVAPCVPLGVYLSWRSAKSSCWLLVGGKVQAAKARLSVGSKFDGTVDYHRALGML